MTKVTLDIPNEADLKILLPLLQRLGIRLSFPPATTQTAEEVAHHHRIIEQGADREDFEAFFTDFEASRKDRVLPQR